MSGVVLENLSTKKLVLLCFFLFSLVIVGFVLGGVKVPRPVHTQTAGSNLCVRKDNQRWYPTRTSPNDTNRCDSLEDIKDNRIESESIRAEDIVFSFQYPLPKDNGELDMDRSFMYHMAALVFNINHNPDNVPVSGAKVGLEVLVGYKNKGDENWTTLIDGTTTRSLYCSEHSEASDGHLYDCDVMDLFEIGHMHHQRYLVNIRLPPNIDTGHNIHIGELASIDLVWFAQTGGFTFYFLTMKTVFFAMILPLTIWNWKRVVDLNRSPVLLEKLLFAVACTTCILNFPVDWFVLVIKMPFMLLWSDIRQGVFLSMLLSYWLIFTGEHMVDDVKRGTWQSYWKQLAVVILSSSLMFLFDMCERGVRLANPLFSLWSTTQGALMGKAFIGLAIAAGILYTIILFVFIIKAIYNIWSKRSMFPSMAKGLKLHYMSIIYRFFFSLMFTIVCSSMTVVSFVMSQIYESQWKWDLEMEEDEELEKSWLQSQKEDFQTTTAFQLGVYCLWNVYVMTMLILYAPSHKRLDDVAERNDPDETVELTALSSDIRSRSGNQSGQLGDDNSDETAFLTSHNERPRKEVYSQLHTLSSKSALS